MEDVELLRVITYLIDAKHPELNTTSQNKIAISRSVETKTPLIYAHELDNGVSVGYTNPVEELKAEQARTFEDRLNARMKEYEEVKEELQNEKSHHVGAGLGDIE